MYEITVQSRFAAAHRLRHLHGKCESLHGHNWKIEVTVEAPDDALVDGIVLDFGILKQKLEAVMACLDHRFLNELPLFATAEPSSEGIARYVFGELKKSLEGSAVKVKKATAWESETSSAAYIE
jgi:6-pyruvoyltetrahydropterin/6-carboxytetrahydropterin synthase